MTSERAGRKRRQGDDEIVFIEDAQALADLCAAARAQGRFAYDTEFVMEDRYQTEVCLIQIALADRVVLIDPYLDLDLSPIWSLVADPAVETVVHAGLEDLSLVTQHLGCVPRNVFDTQIAAGLVGLDYPMGLQKLVRALLAVRLHKSGTLTDWRKRPLSPAQLKYAVADVAHLLDCHTKLRRRLTRRNRDSWIAEECRKFEDMSLYKRDAREQLTRIKGASTLSAQQLAVVRAVVHWRDRTAETLNRPVRGMLKDHLIVEVARHGLSTEEELRGLRGLNLGRRHLQELLVVLDEARKLPPESWPTPTPTVMESSNDVTLITLLTAVARGYCQENGIAYGLAATRKSLTELVRYCTAADQERTESPEILDGWRGEALGALLQEVLLGKRSLRVSLKNPDAPIIIGKPHTARPPAEAG